MLKYILTLIPLMGTSTGAFFGVSRLKKKFERQEDILVAVATGILCSIAFSLFTETVEYIRSVTVFIGILVGALVILLINLISHKKQLNTKSKLFLAMLIHNIPEGIVAGISLANETILPESLSVIMSIALQNIPDGFVVSMPLASSKGKRKALILGILSGVIEPIVAVLLIIASNYSANIQKFEPFLIGFSLSAIIMIIFDLLKECGKRGNIVVVAALATILFNKILD